MLAALASAVPAAGGGDAAKPLFDHQVYEESYTDHLLFADWNGDGRDDLAVATETTTDPVTVYLANELGVLERQPDVLPGLRTSHLATADADGDGVADLLAALPWNDSIALLLGKGDGTFVAPIFVDVPGAPHRLVAGDFDGDGDVDVITANTDEWSLTVVQGLPGGAFDEPVALPLFADPEDLAVADFDGNGLLDVVAATRQGWVYLALGQHGYFDVSVPHTVGETLVGVEVGDFDGDGDADVAVLGTFLYILRGFGNGLLGPPTLHGWGEPFDNIVFGRALDAADFDGDGVVDLAVGHAPTPGYRMLLLRGLVGGNFAPVEEVSTGYALSTIDFGDVDGDGDQDLAFGRDSFGADVEVALRGANGRLTPDPAGPLAWDIEAVDLDGDGREELFGIQYGGPTRVQVLRLQDDGTYVETHSDQFPGNTHSHHFGDLDADGDVDVLLNARAAGNTVLRVLRNPGDGQFPAGGHETFATVAPVLNDVALLELNGDAYLDCIAGRSGAKQLFAFENLGGASFASEVPYNTGQNPQNVAAGDLNGDGWDDVVADAFDDSIFVRLADGFGSFHPVVEVEGDGSYDIPVLGDFDGDGALDCAVRGIGGLQVLFGEGDGTFAAPVVVGSVPSSEPLVADLDAQTHHL